MKDNIYLTYDDVLLEPGYSQVLPNQVNLRSKFSRNINLNLPIVSAAMDTVTESAVAIAMAQEGGLGIIHRNLSITSQVEEVRKVKEIIGNSLANKDEEYRLMVGAAIGVGEPEIMRATGLIEARVDVLVIDTAHGHSKSVVETLKTLKKRFPYIDIVVGNIATEKACAYLVEAGADGVKVGIGPGSICTTRIIAGIGVPQLSAIMNCAKIARQAGVPIIADGGIKFSGDIVKALAAGASSVMIGSLFAGTDESPSELILYGGRSYKAYRGMGSIGAMVKGSGGRYKQNHITQNSKFVPEGIEGQVPHRGSLASNLYQLVGGLRSGMGYVGAENLDKLYEHSHFLRISEASLREGHTHDVIITKESSNYRRTK